MNFPPSMELHQRHHADLDERAASLVGRAILCDLPLAACRDLPLEDLPLGLITRVEFSVAYRREESWPYLFRARYSIVNLAGETSLASLSSDGRQLVECRVFPHGGVPLVCDPSSENINFAEQRKIVSRFSVLGQWVYREIPAMENYRQRAIFFNQVVQGIG
jgi:hypothetical protein